MHARRVHHLTRNFAFKRPYHREVARSNDFVSCLCPFPLTWHPLRASSRTAQFRFLLSLCSRIVPILSCPRNLPDLMSGMIIVISDPIWIPNLISNSRNLSISIEGNQNFTSGYLCHAGRPPERSWAAQSIFRHPHIFGAREDTCDDFLSSERESEHTTDCCLPKLCVYS